MKAQMELVKQQAMKRSQSFRRDDHSSRTAFLNFGKVACCPALQYAQFSSQPISFDER